MIHCAGQLSAEIRYPVFPLLNLALALVGGRFRFQATLPQLINLFLSFLQLALLALQCLKQFAQLMIGIVQLNLLDNDFLLSHCNVCSVALRKLFCLAGAFFVEANPISRPLSFALQLLHALSRSQNLFLQELESHSLLR